MDTMERTEIGELLARVEARERLTLDEWKTVEDQASTEQLGSLADALRKRLHPDDVVTYVVDRNVNYSNVCVSVCTFCAFYRKPGSPEGYVHSYEEIYQKVEEMIELGGSGVRGLGSDARELRRQRDRPQRRRQRDYPQHW